MAFLSDFEAMKREASKASSGEKKALLMYIKKYEELTHAGYQEEAFCVQCDVLLDSMINNPAISPQTFVAFCVWVFSC